MKKSIFAFVLFALAGTVYADTYKCYRYVNGEPTGGFVKVEASSKADAEYKGKQEYENMGKKVDYVECE